MIEMPNKKTITLYPFEKPRHSLYNEIIKSLSKKYNVIYNPKRERGTLQFQFRMSKIYPLRLFYHKYIRKFIRVNDIRFMFKKEEKEKHPEGLIYTIAKIPPYKNDYIIDLEKPTSLADHDFNKLDKKYLEKQFSDPKCKAIIPWYDITKRTLCEILDCNKFKHKIKVIPFGIKSDKIKKNHDKKEVNLLFVSSMNNPFMFGVNGGILTLEVYSKLVKKYDNLTFTMRSHVPEWVKRKYGHLKGLKFIEEFIPRKELNEIFLDTDILIEPLPGNNLMLQCMNFAIPGVVFDHWELPEFIVDGKNGFNVDCSRHFGSVETREEIIDHLKHHHINLIRMNRRKWDKNTIDDFVDKTSKLIEDRKSRIKMGKNAKSMVEKGGRYNLDKMKKNILKIFKEAFHRHKKYI